MDRVILHVGSEKTGTTTIQYALSKADEALHQSQVFYPTSLGGANHIGLTAYALADAKLTDETRVLSGIREYSSLSAFRTAIETNLRKEVEHANPSTLLLSNEHLSSRLRTADEVARLADFLRSFCTNISVILYLRNPVDFIASWYSTSVTGGNTRELKFPLSPAIRDQIDYLRMIDLFEAEFGREAMIVRRFDKQNLLGGDVLADFLTSAGLGHIGSLSSTVRNESLSLPALTFLRELNKHMPRLIETGLNPLRGRVVDALRQYQSAERFCIPADAARQIERSQEESYRQISERYFLGEWPLFPTPKSVCTGEEPSANPSFSQTVEIAAEIWKFGRRANLSVGSRPRRKTRREAD